MKKNIHFSKPPFKTRFRWFWVGKLPLERKYTPKILEYLFLLFANVVVLIIEIIFIQIIINLSKSPNVFNIELFKALQNYWVRIMFAVLVINYLAIALITLHVIYIMSKTEFNHWIGYVACISGLLLLSPICIIFSFIAYQKNEIAFE
ncbi:hypothetical protein ACR82Z_03515 [Mycoplasma sp. 6243]|uniref:hypothetical protein n=1 Tax=Mycoplasma sp. 6243 TaxID=3440865 RepID=UPI003EBC5336